MKVRDYECDLQGVVNNANYQHYLEHTRHEFLLSLGTGFKKLHDEGVDAIVTKITMTYRTPLRSKDVFICKLAFRRVGIRYIFYQDIYHKETGKLILEGEVETACVKNGRPVREDILGDVIRQSV